MFVQFCVHKKVNISMASVNVIPDGKAKNVHCVTMNVKWPIVMVMGIVLAVNVNVFEATKENYVKKVRNVMRNISNHRIPNKN